MCVPRGPRRLERPGPSGPRSSHTPYSFLHTSLKWHACTLLAVWLLTRLIIHEALSDAAMLEGVFSGHCKHCEGFSPLHRTLIDCEKDDVGIECASLSISLHLSPSLSIRHIHASFEETHVVFGRLTKGFFLKCQPLNVTLHCLLHYPPLFVTLPSIVCYITLHCLLHYPPLFVTLPSIV